MLPTERHVSPNVVKLIIANSSVFNLFLNISKVVANLTFILRQPIQYHRRIKTICRLRSFRFALGAIHQRRLVKMGGGWTNLDDRGGKEGRVEHKKDVHLCRIGDTYLGDTLQTNKELHQGEIYAKSLKREICNFLQILRFRRMHKFIRDILIYTRTKEGGCQKVSFWSDVFDEYQWQNEHVTVLNKFIIMLESLYICLSADGDWPGDSPQLPHPPHPSERSRACLHPS